MYNRYIGNTGRYYRVDEDTPPEPASRRPSAPPPGPGRPPAHGGHAPEGKPAAQKLGEMARSLKEVVGGLLPEGMELGDVVLLLILLLLYLEKEDEEILIILSALVFMGFRS